MVLTGLTGVLTPVSAQSFDHEKYPKLDFDFKSLQLDLGVQPQNLMIDGSAQYEIEANISGADTVILYASRMDISSVSVDQQKVEYSLHNDSLFVPLPEPSKAGQAYQLRIRYSAGPKFGLLKNGNGTIWTSQLPKSQHHWVPIVDNPHVELKTTFNIAVPAGYRVWATGEKTGEEAVNVDAMRYHFTSEQEVPASGIFFAAGKFESKMATYGVKKINLVTEQAVADSIDNQQLLQQAYDYVGEIEDSLQVEYPYDRLHVLVMEDHMGETKSWGASSIYLYKNRGDLQTQLLRGIIAQWFGSYQREAQWSQANAITLYQMLSYRSIKQQDGLLRGKDMPAFPSSVYDGFGSDRWNSWMEGWTKWTNTGEKEVIEQARNGALQNLPSVVSWDDYAQYWYRRSGQPIFKAPSFTIPRDSVAKTSEEPADSVAYKVTYHLNEQDGTLKLNFEALYGIYKELTTINAYEIYGSEVDTSEVTFTGAQDSVVLKVDPMISTLRLEAPDRPGLYLDQYKPAPFLIYELQNAQSVKARAEAARKLGYHADNPDLQLAIKDFINRELEPEVRAALLSSLADITQGATGTEDQFLNALNSDQLVIRNAALMALQHYTENPQVRSQVQQLAENTGDFNRYQKAVQVLMTISTPEQFKTFVDGITQTDSVGHRATFAIQELANMGAIEEAIKKAGLFMDEDYSYSIRKTALQILVQHDHAPENWLDRAKELLSSADPRIRFLIIKGLQKNRNQEITDYLSEYLPDEYDARVYKEIEQMLN